MDQEAPVPGDSVPVARRSVFAGRRRVLTAVVIGSVVLAAAGVGAAAVVKSPAQVAAETAAPPADVLTAPVERKVLSETIVTRGKVMATQSVDVSPGGPAGKDAGRAVVTKVKAKAGDMLSTGQVLLEISGRPVFLMKGPLPAYRDLKPGARGEDVAQLQKALAGTGHPTGGDRLGSFGPGTARAVIAFYKSIGYEPVNSDAEMDAPLEDKPDSGGTADTKQGKKPPAAAARGPMVPLSEVVYVRSLPARVDTVTAKVGAGASDKLMSISAGKLVVDGAVAPHEKELVRARLKVQILSETSGLQAAGMVASVATTPTAPQKDADQQTGETYSVQITPNKALPASFAGQNVRLTIAAASSDGEVLAVPSSAISAGADGQTSVTVKEPGRERRVSVQPGMSGDGFVQVTPVEGGRLEPGERVVIGTAPQRGAGSR